MYKPTFLVKYIKQIIQESLKSKLFSGPSNTFEGISSFGDIDKEKIKEIVDGIGYEGFNYEEDAIASFTEKVESWKKMPDPVRLYRIVGAKNEQVINKEELGEHWTPYKWLLDGDMLFSIGFENWDEDVEAYVIEALVPHSEIDIQQTIIQNLNFPNEEEINIKNKGRNLKIDKVYKLDDE